MRIVRLANYVAPHSGGLHTSLRELGAGYLAAGHEPVLIIPGERDGDEQTPQGRVITLTGPRLPFTGGYRALLRKRRVAALLGELRPDTLEVSDRTTLRWTGRWAREHGVPAVMISHESLTALMRLAVPGLDLPGLSRWGPALAMADAVNRRTVRAYQRVICTTAWAAAEFERIGAGNLVRAPLGVDLTTFAAPRRDQEGTAVRDGYAAPGETLLVHCGRLSPEKKPQRSLNTLAALRAKGVAARLVVAGDGPLRRRLERRAARTACPSRSPASCPAAPTWPRYWPAPTWPSRRVRRRPSGWPGSRHSPAGRRWWSARSPRCPRWWARPGPAWPARTCPPG